MTLVKVCGMRTALDVESAARADYLGFILESRSSRLLSLTEAQELMALTKQKKVLVTTTEDDDLLFTLCKELRPDVLQVQSLRSVGSLKCIKKRTGLEVWALVPVGPDVDLDHVRAMAEVCDRLHLDTPCANGGGSGTTNDWTLARKIRDLVGPEQTVLAGGLGPHNVADAVRAVRPAVVDVASGVEVYGVKSRGLIGRFIDEVKKA